MIVVLVELEPVMIGAVVVVVVGGGGVVVVVIWVVVELAVVVVWLVVELELVVRPETVADDATREVKLSVVTTLGLLVAFESTPPPAPPSSS